MKIGLSNLKLVPGRRGPISLLRFDLTIYQNNDTPGLSLCGCLMTPEREILAPSVRWGRMRNPIPSAQIADNVKQDILETLLANADKLIRQLPSPDPGIASPNYKGFQPDQLEGGKVDV